MKSSHRACFFLNFAIAAFITAIFSVFIKTPYVLVIVFVALSFISFAFLRPIEANNRTEFGHFEADSIKSCKIRGKVLPCLTVVVERVSRYVHIMKTASKTASATSQSIITALKPLSNNIISITYDNGCEFSQHEKINNMLNCKSYFARPYCSNDKGTTENINGLVRRFFPKGTNFDNISEEEIAYVEDWINNREFEVLNWLTPNQVYENLLHSVAV